MRKNTPERSSLAAFIYSCMNRSLLEVIDDEIDTEYEISAYSEINEDGRAKWFRNIKGYPDFTIATGIFGNVQNILAGITVTRDPENPETINLGMNRIQPFENRKFAFDAGSHGHTWSYIEKAKKMGRPMEMTIIIGTHPALYLLAASFMDNEYAKIQRVMDVEYTAGIGNSIPVPVESEIVIEAEILPFESFDEGPFAEYTGYMGQDSTGNVAQVKSIFMRKNPVYYDIMPSNSAEHINLFSFIRSRLVKKSIDSMIPQLRNYRIAWPEYGSRFLAMSYVSDSNPGMAIQLGAAIVGLDPLWGKIVIVNRGETDLSLERSLMNAAETKNFNENLVILRNSFIISSNISSGPGGTSGKMILVTQGSNGKIKGEYSNEETVLRSGSSSVLISHKYSEDADVNVIVGNDIAADDMKMVGWAMATRTNPQNSVFVKDDRIIIRSTARTPEIPEIPERSRANAYTIRKNRKI